MLLISNTNRINFVLGCVYIGTNRRSSGPRLSSTIAADREVLKIYLLPPRAGGSLAVKSRPLF